MIEARPLFTSRLIRLATSRQIDVPSGSRDVPILSSSTSLVRVSPPGSPGRPVASRSRARLTRRYRRWGWDLTTGVVALLLGLVAIASWPISALWLIGTLVGIEVVTRGAAVLALGFGIERPHHSALRPA